MEIGEVLLYEYRNSAVQYMLSSVAISQFHFITLYRMIRKPSSDSGKNPYLLVEIKEVE